MGLKEAKDAIDALIASRDLNNGNTNLDYEKGVKFFEQYFNTEEMKLKKAMECAIDNWVVMNYASAVQSCQAVLNNFKNKTT